MNCKICNHPVEEAFESILLRKYNVKYFSCPACDYLFTEDPYWINEAYSHAINLSDTGILERNILFSKIVSTIIYFFFGKNSLCLDYAGGYGIYTRLMRDIGFDFYWQDKYCENLLARGFGYENAAKSKVNVLTAFEVFEHLADPLDEIKNMFNLSPNIIFSTEILPVKVPPKDWWYYGFEHGQHVSFYSLKTLKVIADKFNLNFYTAGGIHIFSQKFLNENLLKLVVFLSKRGLFPFVKINMKSKTWVDHLLLRNK